MTCLIWPARPRSHLTTLRRVMTRRFYNFMGSASWHLERQTTPSREGQSLWHWAPLCITITALLEDAPTLSWSKSFRHTTPRPASHFGTAFLLSLPTVSYRDMMRRRGRGTASQGSPHRLCRRRWPRTPEAVTGF
ncbi:hypothetical protein CGRA01v4_07430 [Colletotrichum graminicola]|nr:hypothetical protein CGRA01v4_07430 [Colletotrichum graminicola]